MSEEFIKRPSSGDGDRPPETRRRNVRMFLLGDPEDVELMIAELHRRHFCEAGLWSKPLQFAAIAHEFALAPSEVMRVHKRYIHR